MTEYKSWQRVLDTIELVQTAIEFVPGVETTAAPRSVLAFAGQS
jgi:hypothetical protein